MGRVYKCPKCGFELDRQKLASINIYLKYSKMRGFPHSNDPEEIMKGELWAGVTQSGWSPVTWIPVKRDPEGSEAKGRGLNIKPNEARTPDWMKAFAQFNPLSYSVHSVRYWLTGANVGLEYMNPTIDITVLTVAAIVLITVAGWAFNNATVED